MAKYFASKYDSARDEVIAHLSDTAEGFGYESMGESDAPTGFVSLVRLDESCTIDFSGTDHVDSLAREHGVTAEDVYGHHIVTHNSQGFVSVQTFPFTELGREDFESHLAEIVKSLDAYYGDDDDN